MKKFLVLASFGAALAATPAVAAMSEAECYTAWTKADTNSDGTITEAEAGRYFAALRVANKPITNGSMTRVLFLENCKDGAFITAALDPGAPLSGANSFTESQAKDRAISAGLTTVSAMQKDTNGIWRGSAMDGAKTVSVAVDFKGNVVAN